MKDFLSQNTINLLTLYGKNIVFALLIFFIGKFVAKKITNFLKNTLEKKKVDETLRGFLGNIVYGLMIAFLAIAALGQIGVQTTSLAAIIAAAGLAIALSLQGSLSNLAAGMMIIFFRPFKIGDFVEASGVIGTIEEVGIFTTNIKTADNKVIISPNAVLTSGNIINYSIKSTRRIDMVFGCSYNDDLKKVKNIIQNIVDNDSRILKDPSVTIGVLELADSSVKFAVRPWVKKEDYFTVLLDLNEKIKLEFDKEGISIPYPQRDLHIVTSNKPL